MKETDMRRTWGELQPEPESEKKLNPRQKDAEDERQRGTERQAKGGRKKRRQLFGKTPKTQSVPGVGRRRSARAPQPQAARRWWHEVARVQSRATPAAERHTGWRRERAGERAPTESSAPCGAPSAPAAAGERAPGTQQAASPASQAPLPGPARGSPRDLAAPTRDLWPPGGTRPRRGGKRERDGDLLSWPRIPRRGDGCPRKEFSLRPSPAGAGRAHRVRGARNPRSPGARASLVTLPGEQQEPAPASASPGEAPS